jgi:hypothetical protein
MSKKRQREIRRLSDDVLVIAQALLYRGLDEDGHACLIDAGLTLRELAGLPPPWKDPENIARTEAYLRQLEETQ